MTSPHSSIVVLDEAKAQAIMERVRPIPIVDTLGLRVVEFGEGYCRATAPYNPKYDGIFASFHGGLLSTVADSIACFAILTKIDPGEAVTTTDMTIRFLAPCRSDVTAVAKVIKVGKTLCPVAVDLYDAGGVHVASAHVTYIRLAKPNSAQTGRG